MENFDELYKQFQPFSRGGHPFKILAHHPGQERPLIVEFLIDGEWAPRPLRKDGTHYTHTQDSISYFDLLPAIGAPRHLPKDILCEVWNTNSSKRAIRYSDGAGLFFNLGTTSKTHRSGAGDGRSVKWDNYRVVENEPQPWFGGKCPIPEGCEFIVRINGEWTEQDEAIESTFWLEPRCITAYQLLESPWMGSK